MGLFMGSKVQCMFCFEICTPEGSWGENGGSANFEMQHTEPFTQEITPPRMIKAVDKIHSRPLGHLPYEFVSALEAQWLKAEVPTFATHVAED